MKIKTPNVSLTTVSGNSKTGPIAVSTTGRQGCPITCAFYHKGCYSSYGNQNIHWRAVTEKTRGTDWETFCSQLKKLPFGSMFRHNVSGDLPHYANGNIKTEPLKLLINAAKKLVSWTYTHHKLNRHNLELIKLANASGFTINASTEDPELADKIMTDHKIPAVVVIPSSWETSRSGVFRTESGRKVVVCPASRHENVNCATCGLCAQSEREFIIGFPAHGAAKKTVNELIGG